jgi:hypothetical protein
MNTAQTIETPQARTSRPGFSIAIARSRFAWILWAIYLASSWTWCIGMFLPVLLVHHYGVWAWIVFAIPNVVGAAAMGWVLRSRASSRVIVRTHATACWWFSVVTFAFHVAFVGCLLGPFIMPSLVTVTLVVTAFVLIYFAGERWGRADLASSLIVYAISISMLLAYLLIARSDQSLVTHWSPGGLRSSLMLVPVCMFGFLLCPYLDLTFHEARQSLSAIDSRKAFGVGFGLFFLVMIVFTLIYAEPLALGLRGHLIRGEAAVAIGIHMVGQIAFTNAVHTRQQTERLRFIVTGCLLAFVVIFIVYNIYGFFRMYGDEMVYRVFMGFYGLVFPAYVWLCMIPGGGRVRPTKRQLTIFAAAVIVAAPMFWMGFILKQLGWLWPGIGVVLLARGLLPWNVTEQTSTP